MPPNESVLLSPEELLKPNIPRMEANKKSALINFSGPLAQLLCLWDMCPGRLRIIFQMTLFYIHTEIPVYGLGLFFEKREVACFAFKSNTMEIKHTF